MTVSSAWYVKCDACGKPAEIATMKDLARRYAAEQGFTRRKAFGRAWDACAEHSCVSDAEFAAAVSDWNGIA
jgi:hypothetical protein